MSKATQTQIRSWLPETADLDNDTLQSYMDDAESRAVALGISITHTRFDELQRLMTAHLLSIAGITARETASESVADVSITYKDNPASLGIFSTTWEKEFNKVLTSINGMCDICL